MATTSSQKSTRNPILRPAIAALATLVAGVSGLAAWEEIAPQSAPAVFPFSEAYYVKAVDARTPAESVDWAQKAIKVAPARGENWVLLAYAYQRSDNAFSPRVLAALRQSYAVAPMANDAHNFRLSFAFGNWAALPQDVRTEVMDEARAYLSRDSGQTYLKSLVPTLTNLDARLALGMLIFQVRRETAAAIQQSRQALQDDTDGN